MDHPAGRGKGPLKVWIHQQSASHGRTNAHPDLAKARRHDVRSSRGWRVDFVKRLLSILISAFAAEFGGELPCRALQGGGTTLARVPVAEFADSNDDKVRQGIVG
jgi:hypothetical protein